MKNILKSRTFWLAVLQSVASIVVVVLTELDAVGYVGLVKSVVDIVLRMHTNTPVKI